ncbi:hypothetical protein [Nocardia abscessus]|uniref:hypothetical protein n=1 Tax=Nocardia abscessus TaxID=120957 RepID=UPI002454C17A|nr:hypothetical protein [Nocardia abscessus]
MLAYAANSLAGAIGADWLKYLSPFHYYIGGEPLRNGMQWTDAAVLVVISVVLVVCGLARFNHRGLTN